MMLAIEIFGAIVGLLYLWLEVKASKWLWVAGAVMPLIYIYVFYSGGLYASLGINVYYFFAAIYGWIAWTRMPKDESAKEKPIIRFPKRLIAPAVAATLLIFAILAYVLVNYTDTDVAYMDAATTAMSVVALWMLARKYAEQWLLWIVADGANAGLYMYKELYMTAALFAFYAIVSVYGYRKWIKMSQNE